MPPASLSTFAVMNPGPTTAKKINSRIFQRFRKVMRRTQIVAVTDQHKCRKQIWIDQFVCVGRAPSPAAFAVEVDFDGTALVILLRAWRRSEKSKSKAAGEGAPAPHLQVGSQQADDV